MIDVRRAVKHCVRFGCGACRDGPPVAIAHVRYGIVVVASVRHGKQELAARQAAFQQAENTTTIVPRVEIAGLVGSGKGGDGTLAQLGSDELGRFVLLIAYLNGDLQADLGLDGRTRQQYALLAGRREVSCSRRHRVEIDEVRTLDAARKAINLKLYEVPIQALTPAR